MSKTTVFKRLYDTYVGVVESGILSDEGNGDLAGKIFDGIDHVFPLRELWLRAFQVQAFAGDVSQVLFFHRQGNFI